MSLAGRFFAVFLLVLVSAFTGAAAFWWIVAARADEETMPASPPVPVGQLTLSPLVERVAPAVVNIAVLQPSPYEQNPLLRDPYWQEFLGVPEQALAPRISAGSGFIVDAERGLVITNHHVVENARAIEVTVGDRQLPARYLGSHPASDIALLQIPARGLSELPFGDSDRLEVGDYVVAIGNPFEIGQTVTAGIVSALGQSRRGGGPSYVQTDAPINPGNSGGPLIDSAGRLIGVNTAILSETGAYAGVGFAVPVDIVNEAVPALIRTGTVPQPGIGIAVADEELTARLGVHGVVVAEVLPDTPAAEAGLIGIDVRRRQLGDVITRVNGTPTATLAELAAALEEVGIGNEAELTVLRAGRERTVSVRVIDIS